MGESEGRMEDCSGHSIINGLLSLSPLDVLETVETLGRLDLDGGVPSNFLDYLRVSPLCWELLQAWSKYLTEGTSVKKSKGSAETRESTERRIVVGILDCISRVMEYYYALLVGTKGEEGRRHFDEFKDGIEKLGQLVVSKYSLNVYRQLNSASRVLVSSSLRLLASISCLSKSHRQEILHHFNFDLPSFVSISQLFEYRKRERADFEEDSSPSREEDVFTILYNKRSEVSVRIQYLRFVLSLLGMARVDRLDLQDSSLTEKDVLDLLRVQNVGNIIFKNSVQHDSLSVSKGLLFAFESLILNNEEVPSSLKRSLFNMTVINYVFNNLVEVLSQVDLRQQMEASRDGDLERYALITERLLRLHMSFKTKERVRLTFVWFKSINKQIKYPIVQRIMVSVFRDLTLAEKMDYFESCRLHFNSAGESKLGGVLVSGFISNLVKTVTQTEREELQKFIFRNVLGSVNSPFDLEVGVRRLANWVVPPFVGKLISAGGGAGGARILNTGENLFLNASNLVLLVSLSERLSLVIEMVASNPAESQRKDGTAELITTMIRQAVYQSFPEVSNVLVLLRHYFSSDSQEKGQLNVFEEFFLRRNLFRCMDAPGLAKQALVDESHQPDHHTSPDSTLHKDSEEDDDIFINIMVSNSPKGKDKKIKSEKALYVRHSETEGTNVDSIDVDRSRNLESNVVILDYVGSGLGSKSRRRDLVGCKFRVLEMILAALKSILRSFGNEFLLSVGYKFDNTRLILDEAYRECYLNEEFLASLSTSEYRELLDNYLYRIILYSLNIGGLKYDWNCNKQLLFKFLESLISIIKLYQDHDHNPGNSCNVDFIASYLKSMWITIVSKLNDSRQNSVFYYLDSLRSGRRKEARMAEKSGGRSSGRLDELDFQSFQFRLVLLVNKTVHNYGILIRGFFESYIQKGKLSREFLERNMDLVVLLLLTYMEKEDEGHLRRKDLLVRSVNLKGMLGRMVSEFNEEERNLITDYVTQTIKRRLICQVSERQDGDSVSTLLGRVFNRWICNDETRSQILRGEGRDFRDEMVLVGNTSYYYKLICDTGFQSEFDIGEIIVGSIREAFWEHLREKESERVRKVVLDILELNYYQMRASLPDSRRGGGGSSSSVARQTFRSKEFEDFLRTEFSGVIGEAYSGGDMERARLLSVSFLDIYIKLGIGNGFLFGLMASNDLDLKKMIDNEVIGYFGDTQQNNRLSECYLLDTLLENISNNELVSIGKELIREEIENRRMMRGEGSSGRGEKERKFLGFPRRMFLSRFLRRLFEAYVFAIEEQEERQEGEEFGWFLLSFVDLIKSLVDFDILQGYNVELYSIRKGRDHEHGQVRDHDHLERKAENTVRIPIEVFGYKRGSGEHNGQVVQVFVYVMVNLFPYTYLRTTRLSIVTAGEKLKEEEGLKRRIMEMICSYPIGYWLILILDEGELSRFAYEVEREYGLSVDSFMADLNRVLVESARRKVIEIYGLYREEIKRWESRRAESKDSLKRMVGSFSLLPLLVGKGKKQRVKSSIESGGEVLTAQSRQEVFWEMLDILVFKYVAPADAQGGGEEGTCGGRRMVLVNPRLVFGFLLELYSHYKERFGGASGEGLESSGICEAVYLGYLLHYNGSEDEDHLPRSGGERTMVSVLAECYNSVLKRFQSLVCELEQDEAMHDKGFLVYYYYMILIPVIIDKLNNPIYYCIRSYLSRLSSRVGPKEAKSLGVVFSYSSNESFYGLLRRIGKMSEYQSKYPIAFIESSKAFVNMSKKVLDNCKKESHAGGGEEPGLLLSMLLASTLYVAKVQQMRSFRYRRSIYNELGSFVLLKLNRIVAFLNGLHQTLFDYLERTCGEEAEVDEDTRSVMVLFIFVEYLLLLKERSGEGGDALGSISEAEGVSEELLLDYLRTTKIGQFRSRDCLYYKVLNESKREKQGNHHGGDGSGFTGIGGRDFRNLVFTNHNVFLVHSKLKDMLKVSVPNNNVEEKVPESNSLNMLKSADVRSRLRLTRYWYHYYSIYLNNYCVDLEGSQVSEFDWLSPDFKRLRHTLDNFPYDSRLVRSHDLAFGCASGSDPGSLDGLSYNLGLVVPIINSRFKLAYSILRERGFQNSRNKDLDHEVRESGQGVRTCSGFVQDYDQLSRSRFFSKVIDNNFIWLRNFCRNGSLQILVNSLSCTDISLRYYSYQTLSLLFEIISFHYYKYIQRVKKQEEQEAGNGIHNDDTSGGSSDNSSNGDEEEEEEEEEEKGKGRFLNKRERNKKRMRTKRMRRRKVRYIFRELPQIFMILNALKNTVSGTMVSQGKESGGGGGAAAAAEGRGETEFEGRHEDCIRLSSFVTRFISDSIDVVFEPESKLFKSVNYFILSRSFLDRYDIPLIINFLYSEEPEDGSVYRSFILSGLRAGVGVLRFLRNAQGLELEQEHDSMNRRFVFPLLLNYVKTNNIYSQHDYFENTTQILSIILGMIDNKESNIVYHFVENKEDLNFNPDEQQPCGESRQEARTTINNSLALPNPAVRVLLKDAPANKGSPTENNLPSSVNLMLQLVHQHSLLDFIRNLIHQLSVSSQGRLGNSKHFKETIQLLARILLVITRNVFNADENLASGTTLFIRLKYHHLESLNKAILRFLGGYSNSYWTFQKLLSCLKLLANPKISNLFGQNASLADTLHRIWLNSYVGLLYCKKYLLNQIDNTHFYNELILKFQEFPSNFLQSPLEPR